MVLSKGENIVANYVLAFVFVVLLVSSFSGSDFSSITGMSIFQFGGQQQAVQPSGGLSSVDTGVVAGLVRDDIPDFDILNPNTDNIGVVASVPQDDCRVLPPPDELGNYAFDSNKDAILTGSDGFCAQNQYCKHVTGGGMESYSCQEIGRSGETHEVTSCNTNSDCVFADMAIHPLKSRSLNQEVLYKGTKCDLNGNSPTHNQCVPISTGPNPVDFSIGDALCIDLMKNLGLTYINPVDNSHHGYMWMPFVAGGTDGYCKYTINSNDLLYSKNADKKYDSSTRTTPFVLRSADVGIHEEGYTTGSYEYGVIPEELFYDSVGNWAFTLLVDGGSIAGNTPNADSVNIRFKDSDDNDGTNIKHDKIPTGQGASGVKLYNIPGAGYVKTHDAGCDPYDDGRQGLFTPNPEDCFDGDKELPNILIRNLQQTSVYLGSHGQPVRFNDGAISVKNVGKFFTENIEIVHPASVICCNDPSECQDLSLSCGTQSFDGSNMVAGFCDEFHYCDGAPTGPFCCSEGDDPGQQSNYVPPTESVTTQTNVPSSQSTQQSTAPKQLRPSKLTGKSVYNPPSTTSCSGYGSQCGNNIIGRTALGIFNVGTYVNAGNPVYVSGYKVGVVGVDIPIFYTSLLADWIGERGMILKNVVFSALGATVDVKGITPAQEQSLFGEGSWTSSVQKQNAVGVEFINTIGANFGVADPHFDSIDTEHFYRGFIDRDGSDIGIGYLNVKETGQQGAYFKDSNNIVLNNVHADDYYPGVHSIEKGVYLEGTTGISFDNIDVVGFQRGIEFKRSHDIDINGEARVTNSGTVANPNTMLHALFVNVGSLNIFFEKFFADGVTIESGPDNAAVKVYGVGDGSPSGGPDATKGVFWKELEIVGRSSPASGLLISCDGTGAAVVDGTTGSGCATGAGVICVPVNINWVGGAAVHLQGTATATAPGCLLDNVDIGGAEALQSHILNEFDYGFSGIGYGVLVENANVNDFNLVNIDIDSICEPPTPPEVDVNNKCLTVGVGLVESVSARRIGVAGSVIPGKIRYNEIKGDIAFRAKDMFDPMQFTVPYSTDPFSPELYEWIVADNILEVPVGGTGVELEGAVGVRVYRNDLVPYVGSPDHVTAIAVKDGPSGKDSYNIVFGANNVYSTQGVLCNEFGEIWQRIALAGIDNFEDLNMNAKAFLDAESYMYDCIAGNALMVEGSIFDGFVNDDDGIDCLGNPASCSGYDDLIFGVKFQPDGSQVDQLEYSVSSAVDKGNYWEYWAVTSPSGADLTAAATCANEPFDDCAISQIEINSNFGEFFHCNTAGGAISSSCDGSDNAFDSTTHSYPYLLKEIGSTQYIGPDNSATPDCYWAVGGGSAGAASTNTDVICNAGYSVNGLSVDIDIALGTAESDAYCCRDTSLVPTVGGPFTYYNNPQTNAYGAIPISDLIGSPTVTGDVDAFKYIQKSIDIDDVAQTSGNPANMNYISCCGAGFGTGPMPNEDNECLALEQQGLTLVPIGINVQEDVN